MWVESVVGNAVVYPLPPGPLILAGGLVNVSNFFSFFEQLYNFSEYLAHMYKTGGG